jgi:hypothetical protein
MVPGAMALDHIPEDPDNLSYVTPDKPSQLTALTDDDLFRLLRRSPSRINGRSM